MKRIRKAQATLNLPTLKLEGGLFLPDQLEKAAQGRASAQSEADYGTPKGVKLKDEYSRAFQIACAQWQHFAAQGERADVDAHALTQGFVAELLRDALGYAAAQSTATVQAGAFAYPVSFVAWPATASVPVLVAPHTLALDEADPRFAVAGSGSRKKSAFQAMQELLNASPDHTWGIVSNGKQLRLLRDAASLTRPAYLECDLADLLGVVVDDIAIEVERRPLDDTVEVAGMGTFEAGTQGAFRFEFRAIVEGRPLLVVEHVTRIDDGCAPDWPSSSSPGGEHRVLLSGHPDLVVSVHGTEPGEPGAAGGGNATAANRIVNAIPAVCAAPAGPLSPVDLPAITGAAQLRR